MATSIQTIGDHAEFFDDLDLLAFLSVLNEAVAESLSDYPSLQSFVDSWQKHCVSYGPGTVDLELEEIVGNDSARAELEQLMRVVEHKLRQFGETVPASILQRHCRAPGVTFYDYSTDTIRSVIKKIRVLTS